MRNFASKSSAPDEVDPAEVLPRSETEAVRFKIEAVEIKVEAVEIIAARDQISAGLLNTRSSGGLRMFASVPMPPLSPVGTPSVALHVFVHFNCHIQHGTVIR